MRRSGVILALAALGAVIIPTSAVLVGQDEARAAVPDLTVTEQVTGLTIPWDVQVLPKGRLLIGERSGRLLTWKSGVTKRVTLPTRIWASGETGLMGLAVDPKFVENRRVYTCSGGYKASGANHIRVQVWRMSWDYTAVTPIKTLLSGLPVSSGRHGGCRLLITSNGSLVVGTGDAAIGTLPQSLNSYGGKTLRLNRVTGAPWPANRWVKSSSKVARYVFTYGHRNVQGLAQRGDGSFWSVEHGTTRDDEVNKIVNGGNYGWNPVPGYNESTPMTNHSLPGTQISARWSSGDPTVATSGATFVSGYQWGDLRGTLAVAALKASRIIFMKFDTAGNLLWTQSPDELQVNGRLRAVTRDVNGDLLVTTSNGSNDKVLRVSPQ